MWEIEDNKWTDEIKYLRPNEMSLFIAMGARKLLIWKNVIAYERAMYTLRIFVSDSTFPYLAIHVQLALLRPNSILNFFRSVYHRSEMRIENDE